MPKAKLTPAELDKGRFRQVLSHPWKPWVKTLLGHILRGYFGTVDTRDMVSSLERFCTRQELPLWLGDDGIPPRILGHLCALFDYATGSPHLAAEHRQVVVDALEQPGISLVGSDTGPSMAMIISRLKQGAHLQVAERGEFLKAFADAYSKTLTPEGHPWGDPASNGLRYMQIAILAATWVVRPPPPRSLAEFHRQLWSLSHPKPEFDSELQRLRYEDRRLRDERNFRQLCVRLGLKLVPRRVRPRKSKGLP